jgi:uncharacterized phage protein (TIGR01671 family)
MQREIKFRAWDTESKIMWKPLELFDLLEANWEFQSEDGESSLPRKDYWMFSHKETIWMQYTGLKDKNGKEIYEGDILRLDAWDRPQQICFIEGAFCLADKNGNYTGDIHYIHHAEIPQATVIGNIYENPELLEGKQ